MRLSQRSVEETSRRRCEANMSDGITSPGWICRTSAGRMLFVVRTGGKIHYVTA